MWFSTFREHILFALSGHVLFAKICSMLAPQVGLHTDLNIGRRGCLLDQPNQYNNGSRGRLLHQLNQYNVVVCCTNFFLRDRLKKEGREWERQRREDGRKRLCL
jgi:hypothetical protein